MHTEYRTIDRKWMRQHRLMLVFGAFILLLTELATAFFLYLATDFHMTWAYFVQAIAVPTILTGSVTAAACVLTMGKRANQSRSRYIISLAFTGHCLLAYTVHSFSSMFVLLPVSLMLTTIYGDYLLMTVVFLAELFSMPLCRWIQSLILAPEYLPSGTNADMDFIFSVLLLVLFYVVSVIIVSYERKKRQSVLRAERVRIALEYETQTDALTGLYNRRALQRMLNQLTSDMRNKAVFLMMDLNHFKLLNDTYGHAAGDRCLIRFARILKKACSPYPVFRYGGDEFCAVFYERSIEDVKQICRNIQDEASQRTGADPPVFASFGMTGAAGGSSIQDMIERADAALYRAKKTEGHLCVAESGSLSAEQTV